MAQVISDVLRPMVAADLVDVLALEHELFPDDPWTAQMFAEEVAQPPESRLNWWPRWTPATVVWPLAPS